MFRHPLEKERPMKPPLACEQAHLGSYSREYLGGGSRRVKRASKKSGVRKSEPAWKPLNFEFRPCEVTSLNCQGIKYLANTSEAKCKQTQLWQAVTSKSLSTCTGPNSFQYHRVREIVWSVLEIYGRVTKIIWSALEMYGRVLDSYGWVALEKFQFSLASFHFLTRVLASKFSFSR